MRNGKVLALDGPAGSGKSTIARAAAQRLGFRHVDTGALYRCIALGAAAAGTALEDGPALAQLAAALDVSFGLLRPGAAADELPGVMLDNRDVTTAIRREHISEAASRLSAHPEVRAAIINLQRNFAEDADIVMEGRDIGTVIFPDAEVKIFLTASVEVRTGRRALDLEAAGNRVDRAALSAEISARDKRDAGRAVAPLRKAEDALELDTSNMTFSEVLARVLEVANQKLDTRC